MPDTRPLISGLLNIDKPQGLTSHDVVARVRRLTGQRKVGHSGTLDPLATGVLLLCLGQATRLIEYVQGGQKQYRGTIRFGQSTDTLDAEGQLVAETDISGLTAAAIRHILPRFQGEIDQIPPIFSAIKKDGQPLYKLARAGQAVEVAPRPVTIYALAWVVWEPPDLTLDITCSAGTYIRSLARDLGEAVGTGAHLVHLTRTTNSGFTLAEAVTLDTLERAAAASPPTWQRYLQPLDRAVRHLPAVRLDETEATHIRTGRPIAERAGIDAADSHLLRAYTPGGAFLAILTRSQSDDTLWQPKKVFHPKNRQ